MKLKLVYDVSSVPKGLDMGNFTKIWEQHHVVFWDSRKGGVKPKIFGDESGELVPMIVDMEGKELDVSYWSKIFQDEEFWARELHNCQNSAIYFWTHYGTPVYPHTDKGLQAYMHSIGIEQITAKDDEEAKVLWEKQKEIMKRTTDTYDLELLKHRKLIVEALKLAYEASVGELEMLVSPFVRLVDSNNVPLSNVKRVGNLSEKIRKHLPVLLKYSEKYRTNKGKWDTPMLFVTDYRVLLEMFYDILKADGRIKDSVDSSTP